MNNVRDLRKRKGIQQKELAIIIGVSNATVSDWEHGRKNPSGERLKKLSEYFGVDEATVLGTPFEPEPFDVSGKTATEQIVQRVLAQLGTQPKTPEARILAQGVDKLPKEQREMALNVVKVMFAKYSDFFEKGDADDTEL